MKRFIAGFCATALLFAPLSPLLADEEPVVESDPNTAETGFIPSPEEEEPVVDEPPAPDTPESPPAEDPPPDGLVEEPVEEPPADDPVAPPLEDPAEDPIEDPIEEPAEEPPIVEPPPTYQLIINEVARGSELNPEKDCWVEIYNPTDEEILLAGWQIRGVTAGGKWIDIAMEEVDAIQPQSFFLLSHYTNSKNSALEVRPQSNKTSILIPEGDIEIELRDPEGNLSDRVSIGEPVGDPNGEPIEEPVLQTYQSFERQEPFEENLFNLAVTQVNLKEEALNTFATPFAINGSEELIDDPIEDPVKEPIDEPIVLINEILPDPKTRDTQNEFIEIWNIGTEAVDLYGWELDDEKWDDDKSYFFIDEERDYWLEPGEFMVFYKPETGITLGNHGDGVALFDWEGNLIDEYYYAPDLEGRSWGRDPDNFGEWITFNHPTPGEVNIEVNNPPIPVIREQGGTSYLNLNLTGEDSVDPDDDDLTYLWDFGDGSTDERENPLTHSYTAPGPKTITLTVTDEFGLSTEAQHLFTATEKPSGGGGGPVVKASYPSYQLINEVMVNPEGRDTEGEWVELFNNTGQSIDIGNWYLDDDEGKSGPYKIEDRTRLGNREYFLIGAPDLKLSFKNSDDVVRLLDPNKNPKQSISYTGALENWSYAKKEDGTFEWTPLFTPGAPNEFPLPPKAYNKGAIVFESVLPNPEGKDNNKEMLSLKNTTAEMLDLKNWKLADGQGHETVIASFEIAAGQSAQMGQEWFGFSLNNGEEILFLYDPAGNLIDQIHWKDAPSGQWLLNPDSLGDGLIASVARVIDGDTFVMEWQEKQLTVRLIGVDTPETVHPFKPVQYFGRQASDFLKKTLEGTSVRLEFDENKFDKYGRVLAYVYLGDRFVNAEIVQQGYGYAYTRFPFRYLDEFVAYEEDAKMRAVGIWQNKKIRKILEEEIENPDEEELDWLPEEETQLLVLNEEIMIEVIEEGEDEQLNIADEGAIRESRLRETEPNCSSPYLKLDTFLPNPQKGEEVEWIRLLNTGPETICLSGWQLDDITDGGSKPFAIRGGSVAPGAMRTFRKNETRIALNNKDDCLSLIAPDGSLADQICYEKTHKNELFTHAGGDWKPKPKKTSTKKSSTNSSGRETVAYQWELPSKEATGVIRSIDEENEVFYLSLDDQSEIQVSYAASPVDIHMSKSLLDLRQPVKVQYLPSGTQNTLMAIQPYYPLSDAPKDHKTSPLIPIMLLLTVSGGGLIWLKKRSA